MFTFPGGLIAIFIVFYVSFSYNRRVKAKRDERKERLNNQTKELLDYLNKSNAKTK